MADLQFVYFTLMPGPVRKEKQFRLPNDFSETERGIPRPVFSRFFELSQHGRTAVGRLQFAKFFTRARSKKFQHFPSQRQKSSLTSRCNVKGNISGGIKGFFWLEKGEYLFNVMDKILLKFSLLSNLLVLQKVVYLIRPN